MNVANLNRDSYCLIAEQFAALRYIAAKLYNPTGVALDGLGGLFIVDTVYNVVRRVSLDHRGFRLTISYPELYCRCLPKALFERMRVILPLLIRTKRTLAARCGVSSL